MPSGPREKEGRLLCEVGQDALRVRREGAIGLIEVRTKAEIDFLKEMLDYVRRQICARELGE